MIKATYHNRNEDKEKVMIVGFVVKNGNTFAIFTDGRFRLEEDYIGRFAVPIKEMSNEQ